MDLQKEVARIFDELFMVTFQEMGVMGIQVEPSDVVKKVISPVKDAYLKGLLDLLTLIAQQKAGGKSADGAP